LASILLVDDELSILKLYEMLFTSNGLSIAGMAKNGKEAVEMYKSFSTKPDVVIMDHRMPIMDGLEASIEILNYDNNVKIIFASADKTVQDKAISIGVISFLDKPFDISKLIDNVKKAVETPLSSLH
jgi:two-component system chemotaxis response regulator CheY